MKRTLFTVLILVLMATQVSSLPQSQEARLFDRFINVYCNDEKARLDNFAVQLRYETDATGYIVFYGGPRYGARLPRRNEAEARVLRLKSYLLNSWPHLDHKRIVLVNGGFRETWQAELWIVPKGAEPPVATPTLKPEQIKFRKGVAREKEYICDV